MIADERAARQKNMKNVLFFMFFCALENKRIEINGEVYDVRCGGNRIKIEES